LVFLVSIYLLLVMLFLNMDLSARGARLYLKGILPHDEDNKVIWTAGAYFKGCRESIAP
jgi:hypothetical protein